MPLVREPAPFVTAGVVGPSRTRTRTLSTLREDRAAAPPAPRPLGFRRWRKGRRRLDSYPLELLWDGRTEAVARACLLLAGIR
jgi:hypothetical protein